eukprot:TRINITY_DN4957_c0_g1_i1.p1 TRINITY_DN4957_c0_g1~~TRINITY_DN4957_c0_g1_i1.p1  ORF type:complete len:612 (+),score=201.49 TRINITY_DN4957_c0_g1_i1:52-1836(+)
MHAPLEHTFSTISGGLVTPVMVQWTDVCFSVTLGRGKDKKEKQILINQSGNVMPSESLIIMGPTGSGKTTLLDSIAGRIGSGHLSGKIEFNGRPRDKFFTRYASFVQQFDSLLGVLTVEEMLRFSVNLVLAPTVSAADKTTLINGTLAELGLESARNMRVGRLSGGQRKRVSIGIELVTQPSLIFMDEPTTGLDSAAAFGILDKINSLARGGRTVIATIHQPSSEMFENFDKLLLLSQGRLVYFGAAKEALGFFASVGQPIPAYFNPAEFIMDLVNDDFQKEEGLSIDVGAIVSAYGSSQLAATYLSRSAAVPELKFSSEFETSLVSQTLTLTKRMWLDSVRNPLLYMGRLVMFTIMGLSIGTLFLQIGHTLDSLHDRVSVHFFTAAFMTFMALAAVPAYFEDRDIFVRDRQNGVYRVSAYVWSGLLVSTPWIFLIAAIVTVSMYFMIGLHPTAGAFFLWFYLFWASLMVAEGIVATISAVSPHPLVGIALVSGLLGAYMLVCGFFLVPANIPGYWIWLHYMSYHTYTLKGFLYNDFVGQTFNAGVLDGGDYIHQVFDIKDDVRLEASLVLLAMIFIYRIFQYFALRFFVTGKK